MATDRWARLGLIAATMGAPPLRAQPDSVANPIRLELNLAATRLDVFRNDNLVARYRVAIGQREYPTPTGSFLIGSVEWNPWWIPPTSDWARGEAPRPPGPTNPMGRVKLNFRPLYFLHGTPDEGSIGRASSHGCIRLRNADAIALATAVMAAGTSTIDSIQLALLVGDTTTTSAWLLDRPVPLEIVARTIELDGDTLFLYPDPYHLGEARTIDQVLALLAGSGRSLEVDSAAVGRFLARAQRVSAKISLRQLIRTPR